MFYEYQFPTDISYGANGGAGFSTDVVVINSGFEQRNVNWAASRYAYDVSHGVKTQAQLDVLIAFFRVMKGRAHGFRFKDWADFTVAGGDGLFTMLTATTFQMKKRYTTGATADYRDIKKPVSGTIVITGGVSPVVDYTTGIVTVSSGTPTSWAGQFDVPCRFDTDQMRSSLDSFITFSWDAVPIVEVRV